METIDTLIPILIVDDSLTIRRLVKKYLLNHEFSNFLEASNGRNAYEILKTEPVKLIISDLNMPGMDGLALLEKVKATPGICDIPFVILTVEAVQQTMNKALALNVDSYIVKPVTEDVFIREILRVIQSAGHDDLLA